jgi:hypothetical protein
MAQKTIYLSAADVEIWERAQRESDQSMSSILIDCLKRRLKTVDRIRVDTYADHESFEERRKLAFHGRWLVGSVASGVKPEATGPEKDDYDESCEYSLARTAKGKLAVYACSNSFRFLEVYDSIEELERATCGHFVQEIKHPEWRLYPRNVVAVFKKALEDDDVEELDV